ncbi:MAG: hypothetical protein J6R20_02055 [Clostridia bacterium]|nr:hypothetical protein [Clostridia bacterium]
MIQYFIDHPVWIAVFAAVILLTLFVCFKAAQASSKRYAANEKIIKKIKEENELRNEFAILSESLVSSAEPERLFKGVALNLQKKISDASDMVKQFDAFNEEQRNIYALSFVVEDGEAALSHFFKANGQPLTGASLNAFKKLFDEKVCTVFEKEYDAFDSDNEETSCFPEETAALDNEFSQLISADEICRVAGTYIKENIGKFI